MHTDLDAPRHPDPRVQALIDEHDIRALLHRYATALDGKDWDLLGSCFLADATAEYESIGTLVGRQAIVDLCRSALKPMARTHHLIGNVAVSIGDSRDSARSSCYLQAQHVRPGTPGGDMNIVAGRYDDELQRTGDGWKIRARRLAVWWTFGNPDVHDPGLGR